MCGIVGVASPTPMTLPMKEFFQDLLFHDVIRGPHATGVAAIDTFDRSLCVEKKAVPAPLFLYDKEVMENLFAFKHNFNIYIGHNRYATSGAKDADANAHPFVHGDIVGVHNGSLRDQKLLAESEKFVVDSDNLYYHLDEHGLDDTIKKTNGAYALVWYNREENTLNFLRNDERPMAIGKLSNGSWVWASEMGMLKWLVGRHKLLSWATYKENGVDYQMVHQLEPMQHMKFEFQDKSRSVPMPRLIKKNAPVFPTRIYQGYGWDNTGYDTSTNRRQYQTQHSTSTSSTPYAAKVKSVLAKFLNGGAEIGSCIEVEYLGKAEEKSRTGYVAKMELFKYQSKNGKVVIMHMYQHDNCYVKDWTDKDIGTRLYAAISGVIEHNPATYGCVKNDELGCTITLTGLSVVKPNRYWPYCDTVEQEGEDQNVLPFRVGTSQQTREETPQKVGSEESKDSVILLPKDLTAEEFMQGKVHLANGFCTQKEYIEMCTLNAARCAECARSLSRISTNQIWLYIHWDRDTGRAHDYLHCSSQCYRQNKLECDLIDEDYDRRFGGRDD